MSLAKEQFVGAMRPNYPRHAWFAVGVMVLILILIKIQQGAREPHSSQRDSFVSTVSLEQLAKDTDHWVFFSYIGSDDEFDYFVTPDEKHYRVARSESGLLGRQSLAGIHGVKFRLFVTVKDGKVTAPDSKLMSELSEHELDRPYKRK